VGEAAGQFRAGLQGAIRQSQRTRISDSPLYEFFPELEVDLPPELERNRRTRAKATKALKPLSQKMMDSLSNVIDSSMRSIGSSVRSIDSSMQEIESAVRGAPDADTFDYLAVLRKYRDLSQWDRLIALADDAPSDVAASPELKQMLALALNRRGHEGDRERAIALMESLVSETGGDAETFGILGRIYKERYEHAREAEDPAQAEAALERALHHFRAGFDKNPNDYYPGLSAITLLLESGGESSRPEIDRLLPRVRQAVQGRLEPGREGVWELSAALQLAAIARDWQAADGLAARVVDKASSPWMLQAAQQDLRTIGERLTDDGDRFEVARLSDVLARGGAGREAAS
jgi:tetratricopeptide (TPR) repeat protein